ncbi:uncharacterized protein SPPG_01322 [Spizellomyces punctatus DAOM BR117]|uniref:Uncharacterized protein n=1 Tax=Spizellomyces punctatus (strain DAOM BR117) TaxID=645134 RepID=A0A0L0HSL8_SPIPD|nr:uncharacterized protein SPPG_01322 [Spizellomyces punctatus DAOM BR117]KND03869.1 hypothetical protein SPPG_01322 [Spizellomyces punctatus DAOM BR117]|eukprot:XP_016611908.1 hypothetical protein SPPG_01322 [Spizellomyces punctatus DAOM BR117]
MNHQRQPPLTEYRDANDLVESLSTGIKQMAMFLTRFESHSRTHLSSLSEKLSATERRLAVLEAKTKSSTTTPAAGLHSSDASPHESYAVLSPVPQGSSQQPGDRVSAAPVGGEPTQTA